MVFGIGEGNIEITLDKMSYSPGDKIKGIVKLELKSPKKARELRVEMIAEKAVRKSPDKAAHNEIVYKFPLKLDGEKEYSGGEYPFEIAVPNFAAPKLEGLAADIVGIAQALGTASLVRWYVQATLDLPMSLDIKRKVQINLA